MSDRRQPSQPEPSPGWPFLYSIVPGRGIVKNVPGEAPILPRPKKKKRHPLKLGR